MRTVLVLLGAAALAVIAGCGEAGAPTRPSVTMWAGAVCTAISGWEDRIGAQLDELSAAMGDTTDPAVLSAVFVQSVGEHLAATKQLREEIEAAGSPALEGGADVAEDLGDAIAVLEDNLQKARVIAEDLADPLQFAQKSRELADVTNLVFKGPVRAIGKLDDRSPELEDAFNFASPCQELLTN